MQNEKTIGRRLVDGLRRFAARCDAFGRRLEQIGKDGQAKADRWHRQMEAKIDEWEARRPPYQNGKSSV